MLLIMAPKLADYLKPPVTFITVDDAFTISYQPLNQQCKSVDALKYE
jgi:hypothetical protein